MSGLDSDERIMRRYPGNGGKRRAAKVGVVLALATAGAGGAWSAVTLTGDDNPSPTAHTPSLPDPSGVTTAARSTAVTAPIKTNITPSKAVSPIGPVALSAKGLRRLAAVVNQPIYWAGPRDARYELTRTKGGTVYIRYLPRNAAVGSMRAKLLIIATYAYPGALKALQNAEGRKIALRGGGLAVVDQNKPESVHLAFPGSNVQIEVFDPSAARALRVAQSGTIRPVPPIGVKAPK
jgi:hypothetical protein